MVPEISNPQVQAWSARQCLQVPSHISGWTLISISQVEHSWRNADPAGVPQRKQEASMSELCNSWNMCVQLMRYETSLLH